MSRYTTQLRFPVEQRLSSLGLENVEGNWPEVYDFIGLDDYPIFDESHRATLNNMIVRHYWFREIGQETWGQFKWHLRAHMHEVMPFFNDLYRAKLLMTDPLATKDMRYDGAWNRDEKENSTGSTERDTDSTTHDEAHAEGTSSDRNVLQDTPMNGLDTGAIESMDYATSVTFDKGSTTSDSTRDGTSATAMTESDVNDRTGRFEGINSHREHGYDRPQAETMLTYRKALYNIDLEVVESCATLFMGLW